MTSGFGVDKGADGSGTSSSDIRKIQGGLYSPGIISGCTITTSPSTMTYTVSPGVVAIKTAAGEIVLAPVPQTSVTSANGPANTTRNDIVYVQQRYPSIEGDANVVVGIGTSLPERAVKLRTYRVSAAQTNSNASVATDGIEYAIPYGTSLGKLHDWQNTYDGLISIPLLREGHGSFTLPTDRRVRFSISVCLSAAGAYGFDNSKYCEWFFLPNVQGPTINGDLVIWTTDGLHQAWATYNFEHYVDLPAGQYTTSIGCGRMVGPGQAVQHYGIDGNGYGRPGLYFLVEDIGPVA